MFPVPSRATLIGRALGACLILAGVLGSAAPLTAQLPAPGSSGPKAGVTQFQAVGQQLHETLFGGMPGAASPLFLLDGEITGAGSYSGTNVDGLYVGIDVLHTEPLPLLVSESAAPAWAGSLQLTFAHMSAVGEAAVLGITASDPLADPGHVFLVLDDLGSGAHPDLDVADLGLPYPAMSPPKGHDDCSNLPCYTPDYVCPGGVTVSQCTCAARSARAVIRNNLANCLAATRTSLILCLVPAVLDTGALAFCLGFCSAVPPPGSIACYAGCTGFAYDALKKVYECIVAYKAAVNACYTASATATFNFYCNGIVPPPF